MPTRFSYAPHFDCFEFDAGAVAIRTHAPVWQLTPSVVNSQRAIADFHAGPPLSDPSSRFVGAGEPFVEGNWIGWEGRLRIGPAPSTDADATNEVDTFMRTRGLVPSTWHAVAAHSSESFNQIYDAWMKQWTIEYQRDSLDGIPVQAPTDVRGKAGVGGTVVMQSDGAIITFSLNEAAVSGGSEYRLRSWQSAWDDVVLSHGSSGAGNDQVWGGSFRADHVSLIYVPVTVRPENEDREYLVPFYEFTDSIIGVTLRVSALTKDETA